MSGERVAFTVGELTAKDRLESLTEPGRHLVKRAAFFGVGERLAWYAQLGLIALVVDGLVAVPSRMPSLAVPALFVVLVVVRLWLQGLSTRTAFQAGVLVKRGLRERLVSRLSLWSPLDARKPASGATAVLGSDHVEAIAPFLSRFEPARIKMMVLPVIVLVAVAAVSWVAALVLLVTGPLVPVFMALIGIAAKKASERQMSALLGIHAYLADRLQGLQDLRILDAERRSGDELEAYAGSLKKATMKVLGVAFLSSTVLELFAALGVAMVAVFVGFHLLGHLQFGVWAGPLGLGPALFMLMLAPEFFAPLREYSAAYHDRASALAAAEALYPVLHQECLEMAQVPDDAPGDRGSAAPEKEDFAIALEGVGFTYPGAATPALEHVDLVVAHGEHIALSGPSGAGKSTLLALMAGVAVPQAGRVIKGDGAGKAAWVAQSPHFLRTSLRRNLTFGRQGVDDAALDDAVTRSGAAAVLSRLPRGLHTLLGERAQGLSGGEAQRMALARAYLLNADIIFADEPTAHLDKDTAAEVIESLLALAKDRTLIVATHDPALEKRMQRVVDVEAFTERREAAQ